MMTPMVPIPEKCWLNYETKLYFWRPSLGLTTFSWWVHFGRIYLGWYQLQQTTVWACRRFRHKKISHLWIHCLFYISEIGLFWKSKMMAIKTWCQVLCTMRLQCVSKILRPRRMLQKTWLILKLTSGPIAFRICMTCFRWKSTVLPGKLVFSKKTPKNRLFWGHDSGVSWLWEELYAKLLGLGQL